MIATIAHSTQIHIKVKFIQIKRQVRIQKCIILYSVHFAEDGSKSLKIMSISSTKSSRRFSRTKSIIANPVEILVITLEAYSKTLLIIEIVIFINPISIKLNGVHFFAFYRFNVVNIFNLINSLKKYFYRMKTIIQ